MGKRKTGFALLSVAAVGLLAAALAAPLPLWAEDALVAEQADTVATVDGTGYGTLAEAFAAADGKTVTLEANVYLEETVDVAEGKIVTLDLNGHAITVKQADGRSLYAIDNYGTFTLTDSSDNADGSITSRGIGNYGTMTLEKGTVTHCDSNGGGAAIWNLGTFTMNGGKLVFAGEPIGWDSGLAFRNVEKAEASAVFNAGELSSPYTAIIVEDNTGKVTLNKDIKITGMRTSGWSAIKSGRNTTVELNNVSMTYENGGGIEVAGGTATLNNCNFSQSIGSSETNWTANSVAVSNGGVANIKGGSFTAVKYGAYVYNSGGTINIDGAAIEAKEALKADNSSAGSAINVASGTFKGALSIGSQSTLAISGGEFAKADGGKYEDSELAGYLADGLKYNSSTGKVEAIGAITIGDTVYDTLQAAVTAIAGDENLKGSTIKLHQDLIGSGVKVPEGTDFTLDLGGHTYTVTDPTVGSAGTETNAFQLLKNSNITFKNGRITTTSTEGKILIQNYSNLTLEGVNLVGGNATQYTLSNNNGTTVISEGTNITAGNANPKVAFDVCRYSSYESVNVTVAEDAGTITGNIELSVSGGDVKKGATLTVNGGMFVDGSLSFSTSGDLVDVKKAAGVELAEPADGMWVKGEDGSATLSKAVAMVTTKDGTSTKYATLPEAAKSVKNGDTIKLLSSTTVTLNDTSADGEGIDTSLWIQADNVTFDLGGNTLTSISNKGGSNNVLNMIGNNCRIENGTVKALLKDGSKADTYAFAMDGESGTATVYNVKTKGGIAFYGSMNAVIDGDSATKTKIEGTNYYGVYAEGNLTVEVKGGTISAGTGSSALYSNKYTDSSTGEEFVSTIKVTGGTINGTLTVDSNKGNIAVSGGTFSQAVPEKWCAEGFAPIKKSDGKYGVEQKKADSVEVAFANGTTQNYDSLRAAIEAADSGSTVKLLEAANLTDGVEIPTGKSIMLDLNGQTLSFALAKGKAIDNLGTLFIKDSGATKGKIEMSHQSGASSNYLIYNNKDAKLSLNGVKLGLTTNKGRAVGNADGATIESIKDCTIVSGEYGVSSDGKIESISNTTITAKNVALSVGKATSTIGSIEGCTVSSSDNYALQVKGKVNKVSEGSFESTSGMNAAIQVSQNASIGEMNATVTSGAGNVIQLNKNASVKITGGTYKAAEGKDAIGFPGGTTIDQVGAVAISGGSFSSAIPSDFCAEGYAPTQKDENGNYTVAAGTINFWGGALRMDKYVDGDAPDYSQADLRFGFSYKLPDGATRKEWGWMWGKSAGNLDKQVAGTKFRQPDSQYGDSAEMIAAGGTVTNLVLTGIPSSAYGDIAYTQLYVTYELNDKTYTITSDVVSRSVEEVAQAITENSQEGAQKTYALGILDAMKSMQA